MPYTNGEWKLMINKHICDFCGNYIYEPNEDVPITILELPDGSIYFFDNEDCLWEFVKEHTLEGWVNSKGSIDRD